VIEFAPQVGDFVGLGEPLFMLHGGVGAIDKCKLRACVVLGTKRTMEQDPLLVFRILVDIAIKALSKEINDQATAVLAIDQLQRLLRSAGIPNLRTNPVLFAIIRAPIPACRFSKRTFSTVSSGSGGLPSTLPLARATLIFLRVPAWRVSRTSKSSRL
jgi:hypothetical protein